ncbi:hypothetical protein EMMF5_003072 [Cystobasidiomycetes sp. EMM_F5]
MDGNGELADDVTDLHVMSPDWRAVQTQDKASHMHEVTVQALRRGVISPSRTARYTARGKDIRVISASTYNAENQASAIHLSFSSSDVAMADHSEHSVRHEVGLQAGSLLHPASGSSQGVLQLSSLLTLPHDENTIVDLIKRTEQAETDTRPGQDDESRIAGITRQWTETSLTSSHHGTPPPKHLTRSHDGAPLTTTHALRQGSSRMSPSASRKSDTSNSGESKVLRNSTGDSYVNTKYTANIRTEEHGRATSMNTRGPSQQPVPSALKGRNYIWVMNLDPNTPLTVIVHRERSKARVTEMEANASATGGGIKVGIQYFPAQSFKAEIPAFKDTHDNIYKHTLRAPTFSLFGCVACLSFYRRSLRDIKEQDVPDHENEALSACNLAVVEASGVKIFDYDTAVKKYPSLISDYK